MDSFGNYPRDEPFDPFSLMLFKALQVVSFLFFIALLAMSPTTNQGKIDTNANFIITMDWPNDSLDDMDLYVSDPEGNVAWYHDREAGFVVLERDDRGGANDFIMANGQKVTSHLREEQASIRGPIVAGRYTIDANMYLHQDKTPVPVTIKVQGVNPTLAVVYAGTLTFDHTGQERTFVNFTIDKDGTVTSTDQSNRSLIDLTRSVKRQDGK